LQVSRAPGSTIVPSHGSPADLAETSTCDSSWAVGVGLASGFLPVSLPKTPRIEFLFLCPGLCPMHLRSRLATSRPELGPMRPI